MVAVWLRYLVLVTLVALPGCASEPSPEQVAQWQQSKQKFDANSDDIKCKEFGYSPATPEYSRCRENLHIQRQQSEQAIASAIIAQGPPKMPPLYTPQFPQQTYQPVPSVKLPQPVTTTCRQDPVLKGNVTCTSQ